MKEEIGQITRDLISDLRTIEMNEACRERFINVLVIEDDDSDAKLICMVLEKIGCTVEVARDGLIGARMVKDNPAKYCIVFLDLNLPGMDGLEVLDLIHRVSPSLHVIIVTGADRIAKIPENRYYGLVRKPIKEKLAEEIVTKTTNPCDRIR